MHKIILFSLFILLSKSVYGEMIKPDPSIGPKEVILIQLKALQKNNHLLTMPVLNKLGNLHIQIIECTQVL